LLQLQVDPGGWSLERAFAPPQQIAYRRDVNLITLFAPHELLFTVLLDRLEPAASPAVLNGRGEGGFLERLQLKVLSAYWIRYIVFPWQPTTRETNIAYTGLCIPWHGHPNGASPFETAARPAIVKH
jgi:hypothetical protein